MGRALPTLRVLSGYHPWYFWRLRSRYPQAFDEEFAALTGEHLQYVQAARQGLPPEAIRERIRQAVKLIAGGQAGGRQVDGPRTEGPL